jgi:hypothetical protein
LWRINWGDWLAVLEIGLENAPDVSGFYTEVAYHPAAGRVEEPRARFQSDDAR